jgi:hypothetical protein
MTNLVHIKIEYQEALETKKDMLSSEIELIRIMRIMKRYDSLRNNELKLKIKLRRKAVETLTEIRKLQKSFPGLEIPESIKRIEKEHRIYSPTVKKEKHETDLEYELSEIQNKLNSLQNR